MKVVVIGAGIGGLTVASLLAKAGLDVTVLEANDHVGGCAATFSVDGYRFDVGATVAGGFAENAPMNLLSKWLDICWDARFVEPVMEVYLPDGTQIVRYSDAESWRWERKRVFGKKAENFWRWQEQTAEELWAFATMLPSWRPQSFREAKELTSLLAKFVADKPKRIWLLSDAFRPVSSHLVGLPPTLRLFVDAQLLISAQCTSERANALYGAASLHLPRSGVVHFRGGMGTLAQTLADAVERYGGRLIYNCQVKRIVFERNSPAAVETVDGSIFPAEIVVANIAPSSLAEMLGEFAPKWLRNLKPFPDDGWGAFVVYAGVEAAAIPKNFCSHHQIVVAEPLPEGNSVFLSLSPQWDETRAPKGYRAITMSAHTNLLTWWKLLREDRKAYEQRKREFTEKMLSAAERVIPNFRDAVSILLSGTPITFQRYTLRPFGWVGGFPQTSLFRSVNPRIRNGVWLVGDSIFPGQSTTAVALGGMRVAYAILKDLDFRFTLKSSLVEQLKSTSRSG
ncbi:MAG: NAD(P)/FAD-dependent oxidoreductase [Armatimonadetes bacterium]|nr:NAD(P)/FAD-dependent oxidoreductase [Armatimonadota bacterium]